MAAVLLGDLGLFLRADGADDGGAEIVCPLAGNQADAARSGVDQAYSAFFHLVGFVQQILHGHAFEHHAGSLIIGNIVRQFYCTIGRHQPLGGIAAQGTNKGHAITYLEVGDAWADGHDFAGAFIAGNKRHSDRRRIHPHAEIRIDEIYASRRVA